MLQDRGAAVSYSDSHVPVLPVLRGHTIQLKSTPLTAETLAAQDCVSVATDHSLFDFELMEMLQDRAARAPRTHHSVEEHSLNRGNSRGAGLRLDSDRSQPFRLGIHPEPFPLGGRYTRGHSSRSTGEWTHRDRGLSRRTNPLTRSDAPTAIVSLYSNIIIYVYYNNNLYY
jgi:hypothetical protein